MKKRSLGISLFIVLSISGTIAPIALAAAPTYIFTTFKGDAAADEKLWVYTSTDAITFSLLANTGFGGPTGVLRDPSIMKHTDGKYYIAFTVQSWTTSSTFFAIASSTDLVNWANVTTVNAGVSGTYFTWAPDWFIEGSTIRIIVSLGPEGSAFRPYVFTAQNNALTSWSGPQDMGIGTNHIDTFVVKSGSTYHAFVKDETSKYIEHATSSSITGPWNWAGTGNWANWGSGLEGPCVVQMESGTWRIYPDAYSTGSGLRTATSLDLNTWSGLSSITINPASVVRHGSIYRDDSFGTTPAPTIAPSLKGDANGNGTVDIVDALLIAQYYVGSNPIGFIAANADTNCSGGIDIVDALLVAQRYVGLIASFPC
jgi:hypothetical protein